MESDSSDQYESWDRIPPLRPNTISETESDSETGSLQGYYDKLVDRNGANQDQLYFANSDGKTIHFGFSNSSIPR